MKKFKKVHTLAQIEADPRVRVAYSEVGNIEDGKKDYWIHLNEGYICQSMQCGTIHEQTIKTCADYLNNDVIEISK
jgi:hypothetical protein